MKDVIIQAPAGVPKEAALGVIKGAAYASGTNSGKELACMGNGKYCFCDLTSLEAGEFMALMEKRQDEGYRTSLQDSQGL